MAPIRLGIVGCGAISQVQHLPNLAELQQEFEVAIVCDRSPALAAAVARQFHVPQTPDQRKTDGIRDEAHGEDDQRERH